MPFAAIEQTTITTSIGTPECGHSRIKFSRSCWGWLHILKNSTLPKFYNTLATDNSETAMAPKKKQAKKPAPKKPTQAAKKSTDAVKKPAPKRATRTSKKSADEVKKPAPKKPTQAGKKSTDVTKKTPASKPVAKTPTAIQKETKTKATKSTSKADLVAEDQNISDGPPAGRTRAASRRAAAKEPTEGTVTTLTTTITVEKSQGEAAETSGTKSVATKERSPEPVDVASENDTPPASPKRKRATGDKSTDTTDLPRPKSASPKRKRATGDKSTDTADLPRRKSPKLHQGKWFSSSVGCQR